MKIFGSLLALTMVVGCGQSTPPEGDGTAAKSNFSRTLTDAEKAKMNGGKGAPAGAPDPSQKKPIGG